MAAYSYYLAYSSCYNKNAFLLWHDMRFVVGGHSMNWDLPRGAELCWRKIPANTPGPSPGRAARDSHWMLFGSVQAAPLDVR